jgi:multiple sugar transport system ATP-binding protein
MNFLRGTLQSQRDAYLVCEDRTVDLGDILRVNPRLGGSVGKTIVAGLRPEDLRLDLGPRSADRPHFIARLEYIESVGNEVFLNLRLGANEIILRMPPTQLPATGSDVHLSFATSKVHCFDPESGQRLNAP